MDLSLEALEARRLGTSEFLTNTIDLAPRVLPKRPGAYYRISEDPLGLEAGVDRQTDDSDQLRRRLKWPAFAKLYPENDTSAYKKKKITLPDGRMAWRVVRPEFRAMLDDIANGVIDGVIVYDLDRLARQPRDLEDLIDLVEYRKIPVQGVTGQIDLMTSNGRAMARVLVTMALKSSEDTSRRVARAAVDHARQGSLVRGGPRRFGWNSDGRTLNPAETKVLQEIAQRVLDGEKITQIALDLQRRKIATVSGAKWTRTTVNTILRNPRLAGIRGYQGRFHAEPVKISEWWKRCVRVDGEYVYGDWEPVLTTDQWVAVQHALDGSPARGLRDIKTPVPTGRKHLLSGLCVCGKCDTRMVGRVVRQTPMYGCRPKDLGGCNGVTRNMAKVDALVIELVIAALTKHRVKGATKRRRAAPTETVETIEQRKEKLRSAWSAGVLQDDDFFKTMAELNARADAVRAATEVARRSISRPARARDAEELRDEHVPLEKKRAIVAAYVKRVVINPSSRGPHFTPDDIVIEWVDGE